MSWLIPFNYKFTRKDLEFLQKCKNDAVNKSIPIIDELSPKYIPYLVDGADSISIPIIIEEGTNNNKQTKRAKKDIPLVEYISVMSKEHEQMSTRKEQAVIIVPQNQKRRKKKR